MPQKTQTTSQARELYPKCYVLHRRVTIPETARLHDDHSLLLAWSLSNEISSVSLGAAVSSSCELFMVAGGFDHA